MAEEKCPVDHTKRAEWMAQMGQEKAPLQPEAVCPVDHSARASWLKGVSVTTTSATEAIEVTEPEKSGCNSETLQSESQQSSGSGTPTVLPTDRVISSIPRTDAEANWIYPSQKQFFEAMKRKNWDPEAADMQTVVPIHNQVNEIAWRHILNWERTTQAEAVQKCGGISLTSFKGDSKKLTPRAWFNSAVLGQPRPFDRHDWTVDRCGVQVPYVIDFYGAETGVVVDVRPKLQSWEGLKLRLGRAFGLY